MVSSSFDHMIGFLRGNNTDIDGCTAERAGTHRFTAVILRVDWTHLCHLWPWIGSHRRCVHLPRGPYSGWLTTRAR